MAIIKMVNSKASLANAINYVTNKEKTDERLVSGINCMPESAIDEMKATKHFYEKTNGRQYAHIIQSFSPEDKITPEQAHEIGERFISETEKFSGFEVVVATHKDKDHIHNHFIINSVNFESGKKLHTTKYELEAFKEKNIDLCKEYGFSVPEKGKDFTSSIMAKYYAVKKGFEKKVKSYVLDTGKNVIDTIRKSGSKKEFIKLMNEKGYAVKWRDNRKHVVFTDKGGHKVRNSNLAKTFKEGEIFTKEGMINEFERVRDNRTRSVRGCVVAEKAPEDARGSTRANENIGKPYSVDTEKRSIESDVYGQRNDKHNGDELGSAKRSSIDIGRTKEIAEEFRRNIAKKYGDWNGRDEQKQSTSIKSDDGHRKDARNENEQSSIENNKQFGRDDFELEK